MTPALVVTAVEVYLAIGLAFALVFVTALVSRVVPAAEGGSPLFRLLVVPGCALLWPYLLFRLVRGSRGAS